ncbi:MAG: TerB family tellurite resistance protein [Paracoccaceae bacterium]|jgi:DnaJ like chaperone protein|nr:molecular chaperone DjiA [Paracoccaceae bacterium]MDA0317995.1 molecular chaperone DjiA [Pseudomonadota bacterium]MDA0850053.1 molecular chaperone DjiA [Pseudomonadota bacterium]MDA1294148.1 molecular chaperone DjiA [Pseudomonadota bacterium]
MSLWARISKALSGLSIGEGLSAIFDRLRKPPERSIGFTIAVIALSAKMAKADGQVTRDEVSAFREVFHIPENALEQAARVFNLARQDVSGFELYARNIARMFGAGDRVLHDLLEGLFHIAAADGKYHPNENAFLEEVAHEFGLNAREFRAIRARYVVDQPPDPYEVLGVTPDQSLDEIKRVWRKLVRESHPDQMIARGVPAEAVKLAEKRLIWLNEAFDSIEAEKAGKA